MLNVSKLVILLCCIILQCKGDDIISNHSPCPLLKCKHCPCGYMNDPNGCRSCKCVPPVEQRCDTPCPLVSCPTIKCAFGLAVDKCNCTICQCRTQCSQITCEDQYYCEIVGTKPTCVPCPVHDCPRDTFCPDGFQKNERGCYTCRCVGC